MGLGRATPASTLSHPARPRPPLIVSGQQTTAVKKLLSLRPLVFTGLISYSLYLWHFPVLILIRYYRIVPVEYNPLVPFDTVIFSLALALIYGIAIVSWRVIERPIRSRTVLRSDRWFALGEIT